MQKGILILLLLALAMCCGSAFAYNLQGELAQAKPGAVLLVPPGTYPGPIQLPTGVTLRGAGYGKTILDAGNAPVAVSLKAATGARLENLTVLNKGTAVLVDAADHVVISGVLVSGGTIGVQVNGSAGVRVENCVISHALIGITAGKVSQATIANNTVYSADSSALCIANATDSALLNNLVVNAGTGVVVGGTNKQLAVDYNNYLALVAGKTDGQLSRPTVPTWRDVSGGLDAHSIQLNVSFANVERNDFHPVSTLSWNPSQISTSGWGIATLAGHHAPALDMDGNPRKGAYGLGAFEAPNLPTHALDGQFSVTMDEGRKSAGLYKPDNTLVAYLFNDLPLKKGTYGYVLPARDLCGQAIEPGKYELRLLESPVYWAYGGMVANSGSSPTIERSDTVHVGRLCFLPDGQLVTASGWSERHINLRLGDPVTGKEKWVFNGSFDCPGLCLDSDGNILLLRVNPNKSYDLFRINPRTGIPMPRVDGSLFANIDKDVFKTYYLGGMAELEGLMYVADSDANKVCIGKLDTLKFDAGVEVLKPLSPSVDRKRNLIWLISNREKIMALDAAGKTVVTFTGVKTPLALSVAGDRMAVACADTGKIHIFNISDPGNVKEERTLGRGDGPYGPWLPDRFHFQAHPLNTSNQYTSVALADNGMITLRDADTRLVTFAPDGKVLHDGFAVWGGDPLLVHIAGDTRLRGYDSNGNQTYLLDAKAGSWTPEAYWGLPPYKKLTITGAFTRDGHNFAVFTCENPDIKDDYSLLIANCDQPVVRPVLLYKHIVGGGGFLVCRDTNHDGMIDGRDAPGTPLLDADGNRVNYEISGRFIFVGNDGAIMHSNVSPAMHWRLTGLDEHGVPNYVFDKSTIFPIKNAVVPSPYYLDKSEDLHHTSTAKYAADGSLYACLNLQNTPYGMGLSNSGATDLARWNADGSLRWLRTMNDYTPIQGIAPFDSVTVSSWGHQAEFLAVDDDGLELNRFGFVPDTQWNGFWVDHPQEWAAQRTADGNVQIVIGDYVCNCQHWYTLRGLDKVKKTRIPITITAEKTRELAFRVPLLHQPIGRAKAPAITIKKLDHPLPIDGDMQKWRALNLPPQILLTPQTAVGPISSPKDCSGTIRLAYQGHDLYMQVIVFDNVATFHQPASRFYQTDSLQFSINSYLTGFGFSLAQTIDKGAILTRGRFYFSKYDLDLDPEKAPRVIRKFANAKDIPERQYVESIYGMDMSDSPGYIMEFKLPLDAYSYQQDEASIPKTESGSWFWLGFMLNDNDTPGTDVQNYIAWPGSFGMFVPAEAGAKAYFE